MYSDLDVHCKQMQINAIECDRARDNANKVQNVQEIANIVQTLCKHMQTCANIMQCGVVVLTVTKCTVMK